MALNYVRVSEVLLKVRNVEDTSGKACSGHKSWLGHWEWYAGTKATVCSKKDCQGSPVVGAHVVKAKPENDMDKSTQFIVPLCSMHNSSSVGTLKLRPNTVGVVASIA